ncbi:unnamed protein product, partial [Musa banksii]
WRSEETWPCSGTRKMVGMQERAVGEGGEGEACCSLAAVESSSFCGSRTLWCCTHSHEMDTFYLFMSPYVNRTEMMWPKGIYELRVVRSMQCTDIWDEYSSLDA